MHRTDSPATAGRPWIGLLALALVLLWRVIAHCVVVLETRWLTVEGRIAFGATIGTFGVVLIWQGLRRDELSSSLLGFAGGALLWMGWFEHAFEHLARAMQVPPLMWEGRYTLPPNLVLLQSTTFILVFLLLLLGMNQDTGCRMFLWCRKVLRLDPGPPTRAYRKPYSRIVALEYVLVSWFMYAVILALLDPRLVGKQGAAIWIAFAALTAWSAYLVVLCARKPNDPAVAVRYAVGAGGIVWLTVELGAQLKLWTEIWVRPLELPLPNTLFALAFVAIALHLVRHPVRGQSAATREAIAQPPASGGGR